MKLVREGKDGMSEKEKNPMRGRGAEAERGWEVAGGIGPRGGGVAGAGSSLVAISNRGTRGNDDSGEGVLTGGEEGVEEHEGRKGW